MAISGLLFWAGFHILAVGNRLFLGWATVLFSGTGVLGFALGLLKGTPSLRLDEEGFELTGPFSRKRFLWNDIESIRLAGTSIALNYKSDHPRSSQISRSMTGMDAEILVRRMFEASAEEICATLNDWHLRYRSSI